MLPFWIPPELKAILEELRKKDVKKDQKAFISS